MSWEFCLQDGGVSEGFTHAMVACEFCLQDGSVFESFTHKMAAWEFCLQDGGVSECFTHKMATWEICLQDGGNAALMRVLPTRWRRQSNTYHNVKKNKNKNNTEEM